MEDFANETLRVLNTSITIIILSKFLVVALKRYASNYKIDVSLPLQSQRKMHKHTYTHICMYVYICFLLHDSLPPPASARWLLEQNTG